jgi:Radical SAM superfamily
VELTMKKLRVIILKPSKYGVDGRVERFRRGFMPNATIPYLCSMTPSELDGSTIETQMIDEYVQTDLSYLKQLEKGPEPTLLALAGVQSHQFQRSLDLAAYALDRGVEHCVIGGPHPMTCDTSMLQGRSVSFALAEAETIWMTILRDALDGELRPVYGEGQRWQQNLDAPVLRPPTQKYLSRYVLPMLGIYPARGCPFTCNFCSVIKIAGRTIRSQSIETTLASLRAAKKAGVKAIMFTSDNFNKYAEGPELLEAMIAEKIGLPFFAQCDTQIAKQEDLIDLLARAGCFHIFVGVESFNRKILLAAHKAQNHPQLYGDIVRLCRSRDVITHFSNIIGFPEDTETGIHEHLEALIELSPDIASFYILTPIPGTQQYDEFLADGRIVEKNLDRFDGTCPTWRHDTLDGRRLQEMLFGCYRRFYSLPHLIRFAFGNRKATVASSLAACLFTRFAAFRKMHPMSGGIGRVFLDSREDYQRLRQTRFGFDQVPLPMSLQLSAEDTALNSHARVS